MKNKKTFRRLAILVLTLCLVPAMALVAYADDPAAPVAAINALTGIIVAIVRALGGIICLWGIVQFGMSWQSHDSSQRTNSVLAFAGGLLIAFSPEILAAIGITV